MDIDFLLLQKMKRGDENAFDVFVRKYYTFLDGFAALSDVLGLLPDQLLQINMAIKTFTLYEIGGKVIGSVPIILTIYSVLFLVILPVLYQVYRKTEIE